MKHIDMDEIYRQMPLEEIPWNIEEPPKVLVELVETGKLPPCKAVDLGCGTGNYAIYLASKGFQITGVDISPTAIRIAEENAKRRSLGCRFIVADVAGDLEGINENFDFVYDWGLLHHISPRHRRKYVKNVHALLNPKGFYLSVCFSEEDQHFRGSGKYRKTPIGTLLYFSSEDELRDLFTPYFEIEELKTIRISGKFAPHLAIYTFMRRKDRNSP